MDQPKSEKVVILLDDSEDEGEKICGNEVTKKRNRSEEQENGARKDINKHRTRAEEYKLLADLTDFPNLAALLALQVPIRERRRERNRRRKERKRLRKAMEVRKMREKMVVNGQEKHEKVVILLDDSEDEGVKNGQGCMTDERKCSEGEENGDKNDSHAYRIRVEEYKMLADLTDYPHLSAMLAFEAPMRKCRRERNKKRRERKKPKKEMEAQKANDAKNKNQDTNKDRDKAMPLNAKDDVMSSMVIDIYSSSSETEEAIAEAGFKGLRERAPAEEIARKEEKGLELQEDNVFTVKEGEQLDTVEILATSKALETETNLIPENALPEMFFSSAPPPVDEIPGFTTEDSTNKDVDKAMSFHAEDDVKSYMVFDINLSSERDEVIAELGSFKGLRERAPTREIARKEESGMELQEGDICTVKEGEQPDIVDILAISKALETGTIPVTENIVSEKLFVRIAEEAKQADLSKDAETAMSLETISVERTDNIVVETEEEEKQGDQSKDAKTTMSLETISVELTDNIVLRKLLRGPRYFDQPASGWGTSSNCGEVDRTTVNRVLKKQKKPCFICGGLEHRAKRCKQKKNCSNCSRRGHLAKDCKEKHTDNKGAKICLKCGESEHDMFSCSSSYSPNDLKVSSDNDFFPRGQEIQCYVCKSSGHLCCVDFVGEGPRQVSCFHCGQSGHLGSECTKLRGKTPVFSICFNCGEGGHFARECPKHTKVHLEQISCSLNSSGITELPTPEVEPAKADRATHERSLEKKEDVSGVKLGPRQFHKGLENKNQSNKRVNMTENQGRWNGGRSTVHPQNQIYTKPKANVWSSHAAAAKVSSEMAAHNGAQHMHPTNQVPAFRGAQLMHATNQVPVAQHVHPTNQSPAFCGAQHALPTNQAPAFGGTQHMHPTNQSPAFCWAQHTHPTNQVPAFHGAQHTHPTNQAPAFRGAQHMHPTNQAPAFHGAQHMHPTNQVPAFQGAQHVHPTNQVPAFRGAQYSYPSSMHSEVVAFNGTRVSSEVPFNGARYPHPTYPRGIFYYNGPNGTPSSNVHQYNGQH